MSFAEASVAEPAAVALHSIRNSALKIGDTCAVFGAGPIGLLLIQAAKAAGASAVIAVEVSEKRLQKAGELGASYLINPCNGKVPEQILEVTNGQGADVCFEAAGAESALLDAIRSVKPGGEVVIVSLWENTVSFNPNLLVLKECKITCAVGYRYIFPEVISLIAGGQINANALITKRITLDQIVEEGFETLIADKSHCKIIVKPK
jgi:(R,R)-butanediol dehydrogenase/meso-butanediol dehydrogenase/diacetyl reductase